MKKLLVLLMTIILCLACAAAQAEGLVRRIKEELGRPDATVVGTDGYAKVIAEATDLFDAVDPDLTTRGIYLIWRHRKDKRGEL